MEGPKQPDSPKRMRLDESLKETTDRLKPERDDDIEKNSGASSSAEKDEMETNNEETSNAGHTKSGGEQRPWMLEPPSDRIKMPFTGRTGLKEVPSEITPFSIFQVFFTDEFIASLASETNGFIRSKNDASGTIKWEETSPEEIRIFLGIVIYVGFLHLKKVRDFWETDYLFDLDLSKYMSQERFSIIQRCLHFGSGFSTGLLHKVQPLIDYFNNVMERIYYPEKNLCLDDSEHLWGAELSYRQSMQSLNFGIKLYVLAEPNGFVQRIHVGKALNDEAGDTKLAGKIVRKLLEKSKGVWHSVYMDKYYNSTSLANELLNDNIYCTGTLRKSAKGNPSEVTSRNLQEGESFSMFNEKGLCVCKWKNRKDVLAISSEFGGHIVETINRRGVSSEKPEMIVLYNQHSNGVEIHDEILSYYPVKHKVIRWPQMLGIHLFQIMILNSLFIYNKCAEKQVDLHDFEMKILQVLLPQRPSPEQEQVAARLSTIHLPSKAETDTSGRTPRKHCKLCMEEKGRRVDTLYVCQACDNSPGYCLLTCFKKAHGY